MEERKLRVVQGVVHAPELGHSWLLQEVLSGSPFSCLLVCRPYGDLKVDISWPQFTWDSCTCVSPTVEFWTTCAKSQNSMTHPLQILMQMDTIHFDSQDHTIARWGTKKCTQCITRAHAGLVLHPVPLLCEPLDVALRCKTKIGLCVYFTSHLARALNAFLDVKRRCTKVYSIPFNDVEDA